MPARAQDTRRSDEGLPVWRRRRLRTFLDRRPSIRDPPRRTAPWPADKDDVPRPGCARRRDSNPYRRGGGRPLAERWTRVEFRVDEMTRCAGHLHTVLERAGVCGSTPGEGGRARAHVQHAIGKRSRNVAVSRRMKRRGRPARRGPVKRVRSAPCRRPCARATAGCGISRVVIPARRARSSPAAPATFEITTESSRADARPDPRR